MFARKTERGHAELSERSLHLDSLTRRLLIFIDGERDRQQLQAMLGQHEIGPMLTILVEHGCVEGDVSRSAGLPEADKSGDQPERLPARSRRELDMGRHFIINTLSTFTGPYAHADLMAHALNAPDQPSLRALVPRWFAAMEVATQPGRLEDLRAELLKVI